MSSEVNSLQDQFTSWMLKLMTGCPIQLVWHDAMMLISYQMCIIPQAHIWKTLNPFAISRVYCVCKFEIPYSNSYEPEQMKKHKAFQSSVNCHTPKDWKVWVPLQCEVVSQLIFQRTPTETNSYRIKFIIFLLDVNLIDGPYCGTICSIFSPFGNRMRNRALLFLHEIILKSLLR